MCGRHVPSKMTEIWKDIPEYEGLYQVSNLGRVRSLGRNIWNGRGWGFRKGRIRLQWMNKYSYLKVTLCSENIRKTYLVHRLVLFAFVGPPEPDQECLHIVSDRNNNRLDNLKWGTREENMQQAVLEGTHSSVQQSRKQPVVYKGKRYESINFAARELNISMGSVYCKCNDPKNEAWGYG